MTTNHVKLKGTASMGIVVGHLQFRAKAAIGMLLAMLLCPSAANADYWFQTGTASNSNVYNSGTGHNESALVNFAVNASGQLVVTLSNTQTASYVYQPADVLTAVFFSIGNGNGPSMTPISASVAPGSNVYDGNGNIILPMPGGGNIGGEWAYLNTSGNGNSPNNNNQGISSTGVFGFGQPNSNGNNLGGPSSPLKYSVAHVSNVRFAGKTGTLKTCPTFFNGLLAL
jgi:hypothetical protein